MSPNLYPTQFRLGGAESTSTRYIFSIKKEFRIIIGMNKNNLPAAWRKINQFDISLHNDTKIAFTKQNLHYLFKTEQNYT